MKRIFFISSALIFFVLHSFSQELTQTIRGKVIDAETESPLFGATVVLMNTNPPKGAITDENGEFKIENVSVGRVGVQITYVGYNDVQMKNLIVNSGKELVITARLEEKVIKVEEVVITAYSRKDKPINEMALISARSFTVEETEKYAGTWGDPSRMASSYAGVMTRAEQVNDIIIRGNSPSGLLWRMDGINIPNPNHFGALGTTGGPISMLNNNVLSNSDFFTGAFPPEYGDALSGAFDLKMRTGNNQKREYLGQMGLNGFEFGVEGPFSLKEKSGPKSSYIANYRYSTLGVFDAIGIDLGIGAIPKYQDLSFKFDFPGTKVGRFSVFGLGGLSKIYFLDEINDTINSTTDFSSDMGVIGLSHLIYLNETTSFRTNMAISGTQSNVIDTVDINNQRVDWFGNQQSEVKYSFSTNFRKKFDAKNSIKVGFTLDWIQLNYIDSFYNDDYDQFFYNKDIEDDMGLGQAFFQWKHKFSEEFMFTSGIHYQQTSINDEVSIEPRIAFQWKPKENKSISLAYGLHSQMQSRMILFDKTLIDTLNQVYSMTNKNLGFSKSHHFVLGYDYLINNNLRLKVESYYQHLFNIPVEERETGVSLINYGSSFDFKSYDSLMNEGTGRNYGLEFTLERFLHNNYYYLITASLFNSKYTASDDIERNTTYNGNYVINMLGGYEIKIRNKNSISFDIKAVYAGGTRVVPIDFERSRNQDEEVRDYDNAYINRNPDYFRLDFKIAFKQNKKKFSQEWALDISNLTNRKNHFVSEYFVHTGEIEEIGQMGLMPVMLYRINF